MNSLERVGRNRLYHFTPLHYMGLIARSRQLESKERLSRAGMPAAHFRQSTAATDVQNGFVDVVHLTTDPYPEMLNEVLRRGVPHVRLGIPVGDLAEESFLVCRYHIGTDIEQQRQSQVDGVLRDPYRVCTALSPAEKATMLRAYEKLPFEILVPGVLPLSNEVVVTVFSLADQTAVSTALKRVGVRWGVELEAPGTVVYRVSAHQRRAHIDFLNRTAVGGEPGRQRLPIE